MAKNSDLKLKITAEDDGASAKLNKVKKAVDGTGKAAVPASDKTRKLGDSFSSTGQRAFHFNEILQAGQQLLGQITAIVDLGDQYRQLEGRIKNTAGSQEAANRVMEELTRISIATHAPLASTAELYARLATNTEDAGFSQEQLLKFTESVNNALAINGTSATEASGALLQLSQALASGALRGDEFNSVNEQMPAIMGAVAKHLGVTRGELRKLAEEGKLTAEVVMEATIDMGEEWKLQASDLPRTLGKSVTDLETTWQAYLGTSDQVAAGSEMLAGIMDTVAANIDELVQAATVAGEVMVAVWGVKAVTALNAARTATTGLGLAMKGLPWIVAITASIELAKAIGKLDDASEKLRENWRAWEDEAGNNLAALRALQDQNEQYATELTRTADELGKLTRAELDSYIKRQEGARQYWAAVREEQRLVGDDTSLAVATAQAKEYADGLAAAKVALSALGEPLAVDLVQQDIADTIASLTGLVNEGKKAKDIIGSLVADIDLTPLTAGAQTAAGVVGGLRAEVEVTVSALQALADKGTLSAGVIREELGAALAQLSGVELLNFQQQAVAAFAGSKESADELALALDATLAASLQQLGVAATHSGQQAAAAFTALAGNAKASADQIERGLVAALKAVDNATDLATIKQALIDVGAQGEFAGEKMAAAMANVDQKARELRATLEGPLANAFAAFGIQSRAELEAVAAAADKNFKLVLDSGLASKEGLVEAAKQVADAHDAAYGDAARSTEALTAAERILADALRAAGDSGAAAGQQIAAGMREAAAATNEAAAANDKLESGFSGGSSGTFNTGAYDAVAAGDQQAIDEFNRWLDSGKQYSSFEARNSAESAAVARAIAGAEQRARDADAGTSPGSTTAIIAGASAVPDTAVAPVSAEPVRNITFSDRGVSGEVGIVGDDADRFIDAIDRAAGVSNIGFAG